jgi:glycosyltransferase involved in cell wall biosynthesis
VVETQAGQLAEPPLNRARLAQGPLVSVLTPSFNQVRWLGENLASVAAQSYAHLEHIVMDGGSTDGSVEMLARGGGSVSWVSEVDAGQSDALNKAFQASKGEIIGWLNSDDAYWDARVVSDVVTFFERHRDVDVVYGHAAGVNEDGLILHYFRMPPYGSGAMLRRYDYIIQPAVFFRRRVIEGDVVDESFHFAMDYELWLRLAAQGARFGRIHRVLAIDRMQRARKSIGMLDVLDQDMARLISTYNLRRDRMSRVLSAAHAIWCRIIGLSLIREAPAELVFNGCFDSRWRTVVRQCLTRRRNMPLEST